MRTEDFDYTLPRELIAQQPTRERPSSRLLALDRSSGRVEHGHFCDIIGYLRENDLLVINDTKVMPARIVGRKTTGGRVEILLTERIDDRRWFCLVRGAKRGVLETIAMVGQTEVRLDQGTPFWTAEFPPQVDMAMLMADAGSMPLPNYIKRGKNGNDPDDCERYQTVYARCEGSIAAPTAGLHFDNELLDRIRAMGVGIATVTLHIGVGTFFLIKSQHVEGHVMHREYYSVPTDCYEAVKRTKERGGRVIAVGTSAVRTLETACSNGSGSVMSGHTGLFIHPGYEFRVVDALITNFHLPRSTPLLLVCAFAGKKAIETAYEIAIGQGYRFYSYGDAMFIS